uniref:Putative secreted protein n=1 Tax=Anopheles marajoara TaxID=58244 RepID=A0A2M4CBS6_9DIPT
MAKVNCVGMFVGALEAPVACQCLRLPPVHIYDPNRSVDSGLRGLPPKKHASNMTQFMKTEALGVHNLPKVSFFWWGGTV